MAGGLFAGIVSIVVGIIIIVWPKIIAYIIGGYLVLIGIITVLVSLVGFGR
ncbi:MAG: DUF3096 domain-containing protein [Chloroflexi bacterium]|nr:DUF3096 domain-containing protein [Chloroflexota bacterium]